APRRRTAPPGGGFPAFRGRGAPKRSRTATSPFFWDFGLGPFPALFCSSPAAPPIWTRRGNSCCARDRAGATESTSPSRRFHSTRCPDTVTCRQELAEKTIHVHHSTQFEYQTADRTTECKSRSR